VAGAHAGADEQDAAGGNPPSGPRVTVRTMLRRTIGGFGVKDLFTLVNLLSGVAAVGFVLRNEPRNAGYAVIVGFLLGDIVDGTVARMTGTSNRFGAEFDAITDHFVHVLVPCLVFFEVYEQAHHGALGLVAVGALLAGASVRHARFAAVRFDYPLCWCGLPRTVSGFAALSFALSTFVGRSDAGYVVGCVMVVVMSLMNVLPIPYMTHRGRRAMQWYVKALVIPFFLSAPVLFLVARRHTFDVFLVGMLWFALFGWFPVHPDERREFYVEYRRWSAELARAS
jgi:phosphatidylserine synthase